MARLITLLICSFLVIGLSLATGIAVMIYGWGLTVQSWWWVIGGSIASFSLLLLNGVIQAASKD